MPCVVDSSVTLGWALPDEQAGFEPWLERLRTETAVVPAIWFAEASNSVLMAQKRHRIDRDEAARVLQFLGDLAVEFDHEGLVYGWTRTFQLAQSNDLTVYDASYVELAMRRNLPLLTFDIAMRRAAERLGVAVPTQ